MDRQKEMVRSALRAVYSVENVPESAKNQRFCTFLAKVRVPRVEKRRRQGLSRTQWSVSCARAWSC